MIYLTISINNSTNEYELEKIVQETITRLHLHESDDGRIEFVRDKKRKNIIYCTIN